MLTVTVWTAESLTPCDGTERVKNAQSNPAAAT